MTDDEPTQFELERFAYHDEIMAAIEQRGDWVLAQMRRRFQHAMSLNGVAALWLIVWVVLDEPGGFGLLVAPMAALMAALMVASTVVMLLNRPVRWRRRWNADHPHMGQYLAPDLTD